MKRILIAVFAVLALVAFVSCDGNKAVENKALAQVTMSVESKALSASVNDGINSYQFRATPNFSYGADETIYGTVSEWTDLTVSAGQANLGYYSQGSWTFQVRALTGGENPAVIASGQATLYLKAGAENIVAITIANEAGGSSSTGSVKFIIETNDVGNDLDISVISQAVLPGSTPDDPYVLGEPFEFQGMTWDTYSRTDMTDPTNDAIFSEDPEHPTWQPGNYPEWYRNGVQFPAGRLLYVETLENVQSGSYIFTVRITNHVSGALVAGQMIAVRVIDSTTTNITGTLISGEFVAGSLSITAPGTIAGTINGETVISATINTPIELSWAGEEGAVEPSSFKWMVDGTMIDETGDAFTYTPTTYGKHTVSVVAFGEDEGQVGSATIKVNCLPPGGQSNN